MNTDPLANETMEYLEKSSMCSVNWAFTMVARIYNKKNTFSSVSGIEKTVQIMNFSIHTI
jgi:hypothetical protein